MGPHGFFKPQYTMNDGYVEICPTENKIYTLKTIDGEGNRLMDQIFHVVIQENDASLITEPDNLCASDNGMLKVEGTGSFTYAWSDRGHYFRNNRKCCREL